MTSNVVLWKLKGKSQTSDCQITTYLIAHNTTVVEWTVPANTRAILVQGAVGEDRRTNGFDGCLGLI